MTLRARHSNSILKRLTRGDFNAISAELKPVNLTRGTVLFEPDQPETHIYFPIDAVISFMGDVGEGGSIEVWAVGNEGVAGFAGILGMTKPFRAVVQVSGSALMGRASAFRPCFQKCTSFHNAMVRYFYYLLAQISYLGICNNRHSVEQRFGRWLLMMHDRSGRKDLTFTQDAIAAVLGTRRATISVAAAALQVGGLIRYTPGKITIRSRKALEKAACHCYNLINSYQN